MEAEPWWFRPLEGELFLLSLSPFLSPDLRQLLRSLQGELLADDGFLLVLLELGGVLYLCLVGEQIS